jgi:hypothetical protein
MSKKKRAAKEQRKEELAALRRDRVAQMRHEDPEFDEGIERQREAFKAKFGRDWGPGDPLFFDPSKDEPTAMSPFHGDEMRSQVIATMFRAGIPPELAFAYSRSGVLVSEENRELVDPDALSAWMTAIEDWSEMSEGDRAKAIQAIKAGVS